MIYDEEDRQKYRRLRNGLGWAIAAGWIMYRWFSLSAQNAAAKAGITDCSGFFSSIGCSAQRSSEDLNFGAGMLFTLVLAPFAFLVSHYVARFLIEREIVERTKMAADAQARQQQYETDERRARMEAATSEAGQARLSTNRAEFVRSLGSVNDFLDLLAAAANPDQELRAKQAIGKELRDLVAKHTLDDLTALVCTDSAIRLGLSAVLARIDALQIAGDVTPVLHRAMGER